MSDDWAYFKAQQIVDQWKNETIKVLVGELAGDDELVMLIANTLRELRKIDE